MSSTRKSLITRGLVAGTLAALAATASACGGSDEVREADDRVPVAVDVAVAAQTPVADVLEAGGTVSADRTATLSSRIVATVGEVRVRPGDRVSAGDLLVVLDDRDLAASDRSARAMDTAATQALTMAQADERAARAEHALAVSWQARIAGLHERRSATTQELDEANTRLAAGEARVEAAVARVAQAEAQLVAAQAAADAADAAHSFSEIRAPFDGRVTETLVDPGALASPGVGLVRVEAAAAPVLVVHIDEARAPFVTVGDEVEVVFEPGAGDRTVVSGTVTELARAIDTDARTFRVEVALADAPAPPAGTFGRIRFRGRSREALLVPASALRAEGQLDTVFVVDDDVARRRIVRTAAVHPEGTEIVAGLDAGEAVVVDAPATLRDGDPVRPRPMTTGGRP